MADYILESRVWLARGRAQGFAFFAHPREPLLLPPPPPPPPRRLPAPRAAGGGRRPRSQPALARPAARGARVHPRVGPAAPLRRRAGARPVGALGAPPQLPGGGGPHVGGGPRHLPAAAP